MEYFFSNGVPFSHGRVDSALLCHMLDMCCKVATRGGENYLLRCSYSTLMLCSSTVMLFVCICSDCEGGNLPGDRDLKVAFCQGTIVPHCVWA